MWRNFPTLAGVVSERMVNIQVDPTDPLFNIGNVYDCALINPFYITSKRQFYLLKWVQE